MCAHHDVVPSPRGRPGTTSDLGDGIRQIRLPMTGNPLGHVNAYLVEEADGYTLVDCGWRADDVLAALHAALAAAGTSLAHVRRLLITHFHFDHYGLAGTLRRAGVPELAMHAADRDLVEAIQRDPDESDRRFDGWLAENGLTVPAEEPEAPDHRRTEFAEPTRLLADGERVGRLRAVWTPGHSPGHLCFVDEPTGRLLTGDHVLDPVTPHVGFWREDAGDPLGDYVASLRRVRALGATRVLPAHGEPFDDLARRVDELLAHEDAREDRVIAALRGGPATATDVAHALSWTRRNKALGELEPMHRQFAVAETLAHLEHLAVTGRAACDGATRRFALAGPRF